MLIRLDSRQNSAINCHLPRFGPPSDRGPAFGSSPDLTAMFGGHHSEGLVYPEQDTITLLESDGQAIMDFVDLFWIGARR